MIKKKEIIFVSLFFSIIFLVSPVYAIPGTWRGYVYTSGSLAADGVNVTAYLSNTTQVATAEVGSVSTWPDGYYIINVEGTTSDMVDFQVCGIRANLPSQNWTLGLHPNTTSDSPYINLTATLLSDGTACTYSCACSGGYCCDGATQYTRGEGAGTCQDSECAAPTTTTAAPSSPGSPGGPSETTTTVTTTTTLPPTEETKSLGSIAGGETGTFEFEDEDLLISEIEVTTSSDVTSPSVTISQSSTLPATVSIAAPNSVYGYLTISKENIADDDITGVKIKFKVSKTWISENSIDESTIVLNRYADGEWSELTTSKVSEDDNYVYFEAISPGLSVFAITAQAVTPTTTTTVTTTTVPATTTTTLPPSEGLSYWHIAIIAVIIIAIVLILWKTGMLKF